MQIYISSPPSERSVVYGDKGREQRSPLLMLLLTMTMMLMKLLLLLLL